jgi:hypothetical protein
MKRREDPNQFLIDWTARVGEARSQKGPPSGSAQSTAHSPTVDNRLPACKRKRTGPARLPVPDPLPGAVRKGNFGIDPDTDEPVRPRPAEVRAITEQLAERMIDLLHQLSAIQHRHDADVFRQKDLLDGEYKCKLAMYAEDFGDEASARLDSFARHQAGKDRGSSR